VLGDGGLQPAAALELVDEADIGLAKPPDAIGARLDDLAYVDHPGRDLREVPARGRGEDRHPQRGLGLLGQPDLPAEHLGAQAAPVAAARRAAGQAELAAGGRPDVVEVVYRAMISRFISLEMDEHSRDHEEQT